MGKNPWHLINRSTWTRLATVGSILLASAGIIGAIVAQPGGQRGAGVLSESGTAPVPSVSATSSPSLDLGPSTTTPIIPVEPWVPATPSPPSPTPILTANGSSDPVFYRLHIPGPVVFVTIDDGWVRDPRVIDFLHQTGWPISIFLIERAAMGAPAYFHQLQSAGATIEDHTFDHPFLNTLGADRQTSEICRPVHDYPGMFGHAPTLIRPPYGAWNPTTARVARSCGLSAVVEWSATYFQGRLAISGGTHLRSGDVILLHFDAPLYDDLVKLRQILASQGLSVGRLESYISGPPPSGASPTTTLPTASTTSVPGSATTVPTPTTTQPVSTSTSVGATTTTKP